VTIRRLDDDAQRAAAPGEILCRRLLRPLAIAEHLTCSYCFGKQKDVRTGDYRLFCDFEPGKDPIAFGFPVH
jgi:hypothetical protein